VQLTHNHYIISYHTWLMVAYSAASALGASILLSLAADVAGDADVVEGLVLQATALRRACRRR